MSTKNNSWKTIWKPISTSLPLLFGVFGLFFVIFGTIGLLYLQQPLRDDSFDVRREAAVIDGPVQIRSPQDGSTFYFDNNEIQTGVILQAHTDNYAIGSMRLVFRILTNTFEAHHLEIVSRDSRLVISAQEIERTNDGLLVSTQLVVKDPLVGFTTRNWQDILSLNFTPQRSGSIQIVYDKEFSVAYPHMLPVEQDLLRFIPTMNFQVVSSDENDMVACEIAGGEWREFSDSCVDSCEQYSDPSLNCLPVMTWGCQCDTLQCWDISERTCVNRPSLPIPTPTPTPTPSPTPTPPSSPPISQNDDLFFITSGMSINFFTNDQESKPVASNRLVPGTIYRAQVSYQLQNLNKSPRQENRSINLRLTFNNNQVATTSHLYLDLINSPSGIINSINVLINPSYPQNTFRLQIDPQNLIPETNISNNSWSWNITTDSGVGGGSFLQCNQACTSSSQCAPNHLCFNTGSGLRCRLATHATSTTCQPAQTGASRTCNQSCTSSSDCVTNLTCWNGNCRNPQNPSNTACAPLTSAQLDALAKACNVSCSTNAECAMNFRCFYGSCRLATNPNSSTCSPTTETKVSSLYNQDRTKKPATQTPIPTQSATPLPTPTPSPTPTIIPVVQDITDSDLKDEEVTTALEEILGWITQRLGGPESSLQRAVITLGLTMIGLSLVIILLRSLFGSTKTKSIGSLGMTKTNPPLKKSSPTMKPPISNLTTPTPTPSPMLERMKQKGVKLPSKTPPESS